MAISNNVTIRRLTEADAHALRDIRLIALTEDRAAFYVTPEEEQNKNLSDYAADLAQDYYAGVFDGEKLVGIAAYNAFTYVKQRHRGLLHAVYLCGDYRGQGIMHRLLTHILDEAAKHLEILVLTVTTTSHPARKTYVKLGFESYGVEPRTQKLGDEYFDEEMMWVDLARYRAA